MKHSLLHIALVCNVFIINFLSLEPSMFLTKLFLYWNTNETQQTQAEEIHPYWLTPSSDEESFGILPESPTAQVTDSIILTMLYTSTTVSLPWNFGMNWIFAQPVRDWNGITLDDDGYVTHIILPSAGLNGTLPDTLGGLSRLIELRVSQNSLTGPIPATFGQLSTLEILKVNDNFGPSTGMSGSLPAELGNMSSINIMWLDGNRFSGIIPEEMGRLSNLNTLFLDENEFIGAIPDSFVHLTNLLKFDIYDNQLDSLPDLSSINSLFIQTNKFKIQNNKFTFDDILPNMGTAIQDFYEPQDTFFTEQTVVLFTGSSYQIDLGIDQGISNNSYQWYKDGSLFGSPINVNFLDLSPISTSDAGVYHCLVTNPGAADLTLYSREITIQVQCGVSINDINQQICQGDEIIINGNPYDCVTNSGTEFLPGQDQYGCDSIINIMLTCSQPVTIDSFPTLCSGESLEVNGEIYDEITSEGWEVVNGGMGCDTTIHVMLSFYTATASGSLNTTICRTDSITVNGVVYKFGDSSGTEVLENMNFRGCDSVVIVDLNFYPEATATFDQMLCTGGSITVNDVLYDEINKTGNDTIFGGAEHGCDSIIVVDLSFGSFASSSLDLTFCAGDSTEINNMKYKDDFSVVDTMLGGGFNGCDSLVFIEGDFLDENRVFFAPFLCAGDTVVVNGTTYGPTSAGYPSTGEEVFNNIGPMACDSIVEVILNFFPAVGTGMIDATLCNCDTLMVNGTIYDCNNNSGFETIEGVAANGCDSTYQINLTYLAPATGDYMPTICEGGSITYNGTVYDAGTPTGTEVIPGVAPSGCDSIIEVELSFFTPSPGSFNPSVCEGEDFVFNGTTYDAITPTGVEILPMAGLGGCDSTVNFTLSFYTPSEMGTYTETICAESSTTYAGQTFDATFPADTLVVGDDMNGCDSLVEVMISFFPEAQGTLDTTICAEANFTLNGTLYGNGGVMSGTEMIPGASTEGCNLTVTVNVNNFTVETGAFTPTICLGDNFMFNGTLYGDGGLDSGTELIPASNANSCDSMVNVTVQYHPASQVGVFAPTLCANGDTLYNGVVYDADTPTDLVVLNGVTDQNGCDSTVQIQLSFFPEVVININQTLCSGTSILVNDVIYDDMHPSGTEIILGGATNGCDSTVIVDLMFNTFVQNNITQTLCDCDTIVVNSVIYDCNNSMGTETLLGASYVGCDSIINVDLTFMTAPVVNYTPTLCPGETMIVNGTLYSEMMSSGMEIFSGGTSAGCDSTVNVDINYLEPVVTTINSTVCDGEVVMVNGMPYTPSNTPFTAVIDNGSFTGCDSTVVIEVIYFPEVTNTLDQMLCTGTTIVVNNNTYGDGFPLTGTEVVSMGASNGCDSTIFVDLTIANFVSSNLTPTLCQTDSVVVNGVTYNFAMPNGSETFAMGSMAGCDSVVNIDLSFYAPAINNINPTLCDCASIEVNNTTYDCNNPMGTEMLQSINGCDSLITIDLQFFEASINNYSPMFCQSDSEVINGTLYYIGNPTGTEVFGGGSSHGCDSTVIVDLQFFNESINVVGQTLCQEDSLVVNGITFNFDNPGAIMTLEGQSFQGCDSTINVALQFFDAPIHEIDSILCEGESIVINGEVYDADHPDGSTLIENASSNGCDSTVMVQLAFFPAAINNLNQTLCEGESITINGTIYNENQPTGTEVLMGASANGCDSTIVIALNFTLAMTEELNAEICSGDVYTVNEVDYSTTGSFTETITGGSVQGCDSIIILNLVVQDAASIGLADVGEDFNECVTTSILSGNSPPNTTGLWSNLSGATIDQPSEANTGVNDLATGENIFIWTLSTDICPEYDADTLVIVVAEGMPTTADDSYNLSIDSQSIAIDLLINDDLTELSDWTIELLAEPEFGTLDTTLLDQGQLSYVPVPNFAGGLVSFSYQICNADCPELCDMATVSIDIEELNIDPTVEIPSGITPNDDGVNDYFVIPEIQKNPELYSESELVVYNRWGDVVYSAQPYNNDWNGRNSGGKELPQGTYYYLLKIDFLEGKIFKGDVTILK